MIRVELIYDTNCPNMKDTRAHLLRAFAETGLLPRWQEWDRGASESPAYVRTYGSPTILVNGQDVADALPSAGADYCRLYTDKTRQRSGVPSTETIAAALVRAKQGILPIIEEVALQKNGRRNVLALLPAIGTAVLPICPACWLAYVGLLGSLGLGFVNYAPYLLPLTIVFLTLAVVFLGYGAKARQGYKPFMLGILAAVMVIVGKFVLVSDWVLYGGVALLVGASLWNTWPLRRVASGSCPACIPAGPLSSSTGRQKVELIKLERR